MSRRPALPPRQGRGISPNEPEEGMWEFRYVKGGPILPARISRIDHEPDNPENILDTGPIWIASVGYKEADPLRVWTGRRERSLAESEYDLLMDQLAWDTAYDPFSPAQQPRKPVDIGALPPIGPSE